MGIRHYLLLLHSFALWTNETQGCKPPALPYLGTYTPLKSSYKANDSITYSCYNESRVFGSNIRVCTNRGTWNKNAPYCGAPLHAVSVDNKEWNVLLDSNYSTCTKSNSISLSFEYDGSFSEVIFRFYSLENTRTDIYVMINRIECKKIENTEGALHFYEKNCSLVGIAKTTRPNITVARFEGANICEVKIYPMQEMKCPLLDNKYDTVLRYEPVSESKYVNYGTAAINDCNTHANGLIGEYVRYCIDHGNWSEAENNCKVVFCGEYKHVNNGMIKYTNKSFYGKAHLYCDTGYEVRNEYYAVCLKNNTWSNLELKCIETRISFIVIIISSLCVVFVLFCIAGIVFFYVRKWKKGSFLKEAYYFEYDVSAKQADGNNYYNSVIYEEIPETSLRRSLPDIPVDAMGEYILPKDTKAESVTGNVYTEPENSYNMAANTCPAYIETDNKELENDSEPRRNRPTSLDENKLQKVLENVDIVNNKELPFNDSMIKNDCYSS